jgi:predicted esterase
MFWPRLIFVCTVVASACSVLGVGALALGPTQQAQAVSRVVEAPRPQLVGPVIPKPTGSCPRFVDGYAKFAPAGIEPRRVRLYTGKRGGGPLVLYWHGMGGRPEEAVSGLSRRVIKEITDQGGVVAAPAHDPQSTPYPWYLVSTNREDDLILTDEIVACAHQKKAVDPVHIHTLGMSAGGLQAAQLGPRRANYIASIAAYSGGLVGDMLKPSFQTHENKFAALLMHGGRRDDYILNFKRTTRAYATMLEKRGHETVVCDHEQGHVLPRGAGESVYAFFMDHPFQAPHAELEAPAKSVDYCRFRRRRR